MTALYVYCVVPTDGLNQPIQSRSLSGSAVRTVSSGVLTAVVHDCAPLAYESDDDRVRRWVLAHNSVIEEVWRQAGTVLAMRFDVIVKAGEGRSADDNMIDWLRVRNDALVEQLHVLAGRVEVRVRIDQEEAGSGALGGAGFGPAPRGRAFFDRLRAEREQRERQAAAAVDAGSHHLEALVGLADQVRAGDVPGGGGRVVLVDATLLCRHEQLPGIGAYLDGVQADPAVHVSFTGPWAPYTFASLSAGEGEAGLGGSS